MMNRRTFTKSCVACVGGTIAGGLFPACQSTHYTSGMIGQNGIAVMKSEFIYLKKDQSVVRDYIVIRNEMLEFPIYLYRFSDNDYSALLMKCTHRGNELQASGDHLSCPAHGSEFNNRGAVAQGPADKHLRSFPIVADDETIFIDLRS